METVKKNKFVALVFIFCLLIASASISWTVYAATHPSWTTTIETGSMIDMASYVIFKDGSTYFAKNGMTGAIEFSGTSAATVIQNVFDTTPSSVFFKNGTYNLAGATVTARSILMIAGEGCGDNGTILSGGTLKIVQPSFTWNYGFSITNIKFSSVGSIVQLWLVELPEGEVWHNTFSKTSFSPGIPNLLLENCSSIKVDSNWFDGYNMQILQINGTTGVLPGTFHRVTNNDFGSVSGALPSFATPSDVAAIYCVGALSGFNAVDNNIAWVNPQGIFFYADDGSRNQLIANNRISAPTGNYTINVHGGHNIVSSNKISAASTYGRGVQVRTGALTQIIGNDFYGMDISINGSMTTTIIANNVFTVYNETTNPAIAINFVTCPYNQISGNFFYDLNSTPTTYFKSDVNSFENQVSGNYFSNASAFVIDAQVTDVIRHNFCYITENSGRQTINAGLSTQFNHGLDGTPTHVYCGFETAGYGDWIWSATSTQITITVANLGTYNFTWAGDIYDSWKG